MKKQLGKKDVEELQSRITFPIDKKDHFELVENELGKHWTINGKIALVEKDGIVLPHLKFLLQNLVLKHAVVDMGAVKFVVSGADVMRPGIKEFSPDLKKDELVVVLDINNKKPLAVGKMLFSGEEAKAMDKGRIIKNLHWVGDLFWNA